MFININEQNWDTILQDLNDNLTDNLNKKVEEHYFKKEYNLSSKVKARFENDEIILEGISFDGYLDVVSEFQDESIKNGISVRIWGAPSVEPYFTYQCEQFLNQEGGTYKNVDKFKEAIKLVSDNWYKGNQLKKNEKIQFDELLGINSIEELARKFLDFDINLTTFDYVMKNLVENETIKKPEPKNKQLPENEEPAKNEKINPKDQNEPISEIQARPVFYDRNKGHGSIDVYLERLEFFKKYTKDLGLDEQELKNTLDSFMYAINGFDLEFKELSDNSLSIGIPKHVSEIIWCAPLTPEQIKRNLESTIEFYENIQTEYKDLEHLKPYIPMNEKLIGVLKNLVKTKEYEKISETYNKSLFDLIKRLAEPKNDRLVQYLDNTITFDAPELLGKNDLTVKYEPKKDILSIYNNEEKQVLKLNLKEKLYGYKPERAKIQTINGIATITY